ncbi:hypothetical protein J3459_008256 [Metarhizium acridum]|nr:hypothetical protein J3459_008256 [Metarhizium acridum]
MWVCEICLALHAVNRQDTPQSPLATSCFRKPGNAVIGRKLCWPQHRHVQIALKYTRLGVQDPDRRRHLAELLDPVFGNHPPDPQDSWIAHVTYASRAKIVNRRYLLKYTWHYNATSEPIESLCRGYNAHLLICNHQYVPGYLMAKIFQRIEQPGEQEAARIAAQSPQPLTEPLAVRRATRESLLDDQRGIELTDSCTLCPTDFSICVGEDCVWFSAWYDLGPEGSPFDEAWTCHRINEPWGTISRSLKARHVPGSIRRLYQQTAHRDIENEVE